MFFAVLKLEMWLSYTITEFYVACAFGQRVFHENCCNQNHRVKHFRIKFYETYLVLTDLVWCCFPQLLYLYDLAFRGMTDDFLLTKKEHVQI